MLSIVILVYCTFSAFDCSDPRKRWVTYRRKLLPTLYHTATSCTLNIISIRPPLMCMCIYNYLLFSLLFFVLLYLKFLFALMYIENLVQVLGHSAFYCTSHTVNTWKGRLCVIDIRKYTEQTYTCTVGEHHTSTAVGGCVTTCSHQRVH